MSRGFASNYRIVLLAGLVLLCFVGVGARLVDLHVLNRARWASNVEHVRDSFSIQEARRGDILDARGDKLATSRTLLVVGVDPQVLRPEDEGRWPELARLLDLPLKELESIFQTRTRRRQLSGEDGAAFEDVPVKWAKLSDSVSESVYDQIVALDIQGVYGNRSYRRTYPLNSRAAHIVGFVNRENVAAAGLEAFADFYLRGQDGWRESEKDGRRRELAQFRSRNVPASDGYSVVVSIDSAVQRMVDQELEEIARLYRPKKATIIVSDANSGFILGLGNYPTFDLNDYSNAPLSAHRNVAITDQYDPGSTFKIVAAAAALEENLVTPDSRFDCSQETIVYNGRELRFMSEDHPSPVPMSVRDIISKSSNRGAAQLAMKLGDQKFYDYARAFGFGEKAGFPFGGEISGLINPPNKWSRIDITRIPAGYSVAATPLQVHYAMGVIASGGELLRPQLIREIRDSRGETVYTFGGVSRRRVISRDTAREMAGMLERVVSKQGTAPNAEVPGYQVAGKTGTAQKLIDGRYSDRHHVTSFTGFFPASAPRVVITVVVDEGKPKVGAAYGGTVAAPSFKHLAEQLIPYLDIKQPNSAAPWSLAMEGGRP